MVRSLDDCVTSVEALSQQLAQSSVEHESCVHIAMPPEGLQAAPEGLRSPCCSRRIMTSVRTILRAVRLRGGAGRALCKHVQLFGLEPQCKGFGQKSFALMHFLKFCKKGGGGLGTSKAAYCQAESHFTK